MRSLMPSPVRRAGRTARTQALALCVFSLLGLLPAARALANPSEVFRRAAPGVVIVARAWVSPDTVVSGNAGVVGSGMVIGPGQVITNCHVAGDGAGLVVRRRAEWFHARLRYADRPRDLCQLEVPGLDAAAPGQVAIRDLKVGQRVYSIGAPMGLELSLGEGLISALRMRDGFLYIQTSAAISQGSSGGGLFDESGRLVGITTFYVAGGQGLNFAVPATWIAEVPARAQLAGATRRSPASAGRSDTGLAAAAAPPEDGASAFGEVLW